jgi:hypothetical protein
MRLTVKGFPKFVNRSVPWSAVENHEYLNASFVLFRFLLPRPCIKQDTYLWLNDTSKRIEAPPMRIDLFGILFFDAQKDLDWYNALAIQKKVSARSLFMSFYLIGALNVHVAIDRDLGGILIKGEKERRERGIKKKKVGGIYMGAGIGV